MLEAVRSASQVALDTQALIYFFEENVQFCALVEPIIQAIDNGEKRGIFSYITLLEVLVKPLELKRADLAERYRGILLRNANTRILPVDLAVAEEAARIRAEYKFKTPDAIQLATAKIGGADVFVTNDDQLKRFRELPVVVLADHTGR